MGGRGRARSVQHSARCGLTTRTLRPDTRHMCCAIRRCNTAGYRESRRPGPVRPSSRIHSGAPRRAAGGPFAPHRATTTCTFSVRWDHTHQEEEILLSSDGCDATDELPDAELLIPRSAPDVYSGPLQEFPSIPSSTFTPALEESHDRPEADSERPYGRGDGRRARPRESRRRGVGRPGCARGAAGPGVPAGRVPSS